MTVIHGKAKEHDSRLETSFKRYWECHVTLRK